MFSTDENSSITDEDIKYFKNNIQNIEDIDNLISQLEVEFTKELYDTFSFLSSIENQNQSIDSLSDQMSRISESSELISNPENSPFSPIIKYCNDNKSVYGYYKRMCDAKMQINYLQGLEVNNIDSANQFIANTLSYPDPFNSWVTTSDITPDNFAKSLRIASNYLARNKFANNPNDEKIQYTKQNLETFKSKILDCPVYADDQYVFIPFSFFGSYLLDPANDQLFLEYFNSFTKKYYEYILYKKNQPSEFYRSHKNSEAIELFKPLILENLKKFTFYNNNSENKCEKIFNTIIEGLISQQTHRFRVAHQIDYNDFCGSTLDDLLQYEKNFYLNKVKKYLEQIKKENLNKFIDKSFLLDLKEVHSELIDDLKFKFNELYNSIITSKKNPDNSIIQLVFLSDIIHKYKTIFDCKYYYYKDKIYGFAEERGAKSMPFKSNLQEIVYSNREAEIQKIIEPFEDFLKNFLVYDRYNPLSKNQYKYIYKFTHGFLKSFCKIWDDNLKKKNISSDMVEDCSQKYVFCLCKGLKIYGTSTEEDPKFQTFEEISISLYDQFKPIIVKDEIDISSENNIDLIIQNINNVNIQKLKRICYSDLKEILDANKKLQQC